MWLQMKQLRCFMYVSTAYANAHLGSGITAQEQLYPVRDEQGQALDHAALAHQLLSLPAAQAQKEVRFHPPFPSACVAMVSPHYLDCDASCTQSEMSQDRHLIMLTLRITCSPCLLRYKNKRCAFVKTPM